jgi:hypothetical protein
MMRGAARLNINADLRSSLTYKGIQEHDVAVFYGLAGGLDRIFRDYPESGRKAVYIDLGYWGRRKRGRFDGFHKLSVNARHPTDYFQARPHGSERFRSHDVPIRPWRSSGTHIVVAGMSAKAAWAEGLQPHEWERRTIARLRQLTRRPIIYRPKPNWAEAKPIEGSTFDRLTPLESTLDRCHAVVTHHSNVAVDALLAGVPCICPHGVASLLSGHDLEQIESPPMPDGREQWAADLAWTQWSVGEMEGGAAFQYLRSEGLI